MALSLTVTGHAKYTDAVLLEIAPPWWDARKICRDRRFAMTGKPSYALDYEAYLSLEEMQALHEQYRAAATTGSYAYEKWQDIIQPMLHTLDEALYTCAEQYWYFHIRVFEWESGLSD